MPVTATESIQALVAPAVMISSSSLFFLGLNARHSSLLSRIRLLTDERRKLTREINHNQEVEREEQLRLMSVKSQLRFLLRRAKYVRNSVFCNIIAATLFILSSLAIGLDYLLENPVSQDFPLSLFVLGMLMFLGGVTFTGVDELISYSVILMEMKDDQEPK